MQRVLFLDLELLHFADATGHEVALVGIAERAQGHHVISHRGENRAEASGRATVFDDPSFRFAQGILAKRLERGTLEEFQVRVYREEEVSRSERDRVALYS